MFSHLIIQHLPATEEEFNALCLYSAFAFVAISFLYHLLRGKLSEFHVMVWVKQAIAGLSFPYGVLLIFVLIKPSLLQIIGQTVKFLSIAGFVMVAMAIRNLFKIG